MFSENKGMLFATPVPVGLNMNWCSHNCRYCFANLNKPDRKFDPKKTFNQLMNVTKGKTLLSWFLRNKYPVMASNLVDVFAKSNYKYFLEIYNVMKTNGIPLYFQTRGGDGLDEVLKTLPKSAFYISITSHDDELIKKIEPSAPKPSERIALVKKLHSLGHNVAVGINPYMPNYCDAEKIIQQTRDFTDKYWINGIHISNNQLKNISQKYKDLIKEEEKFCIKNNSMESLTSLCYEYGILPAGVFGYHLTNFMDLFDCYENKMPTGVQFNSHIVKTKKEGDIITFKDWEDYMSQLLPESMSTVDSGYLVSVKREYKNLKPFYTKKELIRFHWDNWRLSQGSPVKNRCIVPLNNGKDDEMKMIYISKPFTGD